MSARKEKIMRYTQKDAFNAFKRLANCLGKSLNAWKKVEGKNVAEIGAWEFDYNSIYGGAVINEICNEGGGVSQPFGSNRLKPFEFCVAVKMMVSVVMNKELEVEDNFIATVEETVTLKDKLHRRNMQIKDLKNRVNQTLECLSWRGDETRKQLLAFIQDAQEELRR